MKKIISTLFISLIVLLPFVPTQNVHACSCIAPGTVEQEMERASAVFLGTVSSIEEKRFGERSKEVILSVDTAWKGVDNKNVEIVTAQDSAACGFNFEDGQQYLVYTNGEDPYNVSLCSRTVALEQANEDLAALGEGYVPEEVDEENGLPERTMMMSVGVVGGIGIIVLVVLLLFRRKK